MRLQMPRGCDSVTHGPHGYTVSNIDWCVEVPDEVGHVLLRTGAGAVWIDRPVPPEPPGLVVLEHDDVRAATTFRGRVYACEAVKLGDKTVGRMLAPMAIAAVLTESHGFRHVPVE